VRAYRGTFDAPEHVEERLYSGGFLSFADQRLFGEFHAADPQERPAIVERIADRRAQEIGWRLIYDETPEVLPTEHREAIAAERRRRLAAPADSPWVSIAGARERIATERSKRGAEVAELFREYEEYLETVEGELRVMA
jgi:exonuclease I